MTIVVFPAQPHQTTLNEIQVHDDKNYFYGEENKTYNI